MSWMQATAAKIVCTTRRKFQTIGFSLETVQFLTIPLSSNSSHHVPLLPRLHFYFCLFGKRQQQQRVCKMLCGHSLWCATHFCATLKGLCQQNVTTTIEWENCSQRITTTTPKRTDWIWWWLSVLRISDSVTRLHPMLCWHLTSFNFSPTHVMLGMHPVYLPIHLDQT